MAENNEDGELVYTKTIRKNGKVYVHPTGCYVFRAKKKSKDEKDKD